MDNLNLLNIAGITLAFSGKDISSVLSSPCFCPFTKEAESFLYVPVSMTETIPENAKIGCSHCYDRTTVALSEDGRTAYIAGNDVVDRLLLSKCVSFLVCMLISLHRGAMLHASIVSYRGNAVLFSGDSGAGKSTQARLWEKHLGAKVLNHDKAIVRHDDRWIAYGSPWSGETACYINDSAAVGALVFLEHGTANDLIRLDTKRALLLVFAQVRFFFEQTGVLDVFLNTLEKLLSEVPVYLYRCLPEQSAVMLLKERLEQDGGISGED